MIKFKRINYNKLTAKQQESYNFQKVSAILADVGYTTIKLSYDWESADFIAIHVDGKTILKVQLKGRFSINKKYSSKDLYIAFREGEKLYFYPHDELRDYVLQNSNVKNTESWKKKVIGIQNQYQST